MVYSKNGVVRHYSSYFSRYSLTRLLVFRFISISQSLMLEAKIPDGPLEQKWSHYRSTAKLVSTGNRRKIHVIIVGTGLSGSSLGASLGEMGYQVTCFCFQDKGLGTPSPGSPGRHVAGAMPLLRPGLGTPTRAV